MSDFDHHQESCHTIELLGSIICTPVTTIENDVTSDSQKNNNNNPDELSIYTINISTSIPEFYQERITSGKSESEIDNFFCSIDWITNELMDQIYTYVPQLVDITTDKIRLSSIK